MRSRRIYGSKECCIYHCVTRTVNGEMLFGVKEKRSVTKDAASGGVFFWCGAVDVCVDGESFPCIGAGEMGCFAGIR